MRDARADAGAPFVNSSQLDLWEREIAKIPWRGMSPRSLTSCRKALFLRREPQKDDRFFVDPNQYDLFRAAIPGRPQYGGAPCVLPLPRRLS